MQLNALRYFVMVATTSSFAATAKHFQVPPSSVSRFISGLEQVMCAEKNVGFNLINYRYSLGVYHEQKAKKLYS